jgi:hypothetical protein
VLRLLKEKGIPINNIISDLKDLIIKTIISGHATI